MAPTTRNTKNLKVAIPKQPSSSIQKVDIPRLQLHFDGGRWVLKVLITICSIFKDFHFFFSAPVNENLVEITSYLTHRKNGFYTLLSNITTEYEINHHHFKILYNFTYSSTNYLQLIAISYELFIRTSHSPRQLLLSKRMEQCKQTYLHNRNTPRDRLLGLRRRTRQGYLHLQSRKQGQSQATGHLLQAQQDPLIQCRFRTASTATSGRSLLRLPVTEL